MLVFLCGPLRPVITGFHKQYSKPIAKVIFHFSLIIKLIQKTEKKEAGRSWPCFL